MGLAGNAQANLRLMTSLVSKAETYVDRASACEFAQLELARLCFSVDVTNIQLALDYKRIEDIRGECDTLCKKSFIARARGDAVLADDWAGRYLTLYDSHMKALGDEEDGPGTQDSESSK
jgi:hypothetical protein